MDRRCAAPVTSQDAACDASLSTQKGTVVRKPARRLLEWARLASLLVSDFSRRWRFPTIATEEQTHEQPCPGTAFLSTLASAPVREPAAEGTASLRDPKRRM